MDKDVERVQKLFRKAELYVWLSSMFWKWRRADAFSFAWGAVRWIDDIVDTPGDFKKKTKFIDDQIKLAKNYKKADMSKLKPEQRWIVRYMQDDERYGYGTKKYFFSILDSIKMDSKRRNKVLTWKQYMALLMKRTVHPRHLMYKIVYKDHMDTKKMERFFYDIGMSHTLLDDIADLKKDLKARHINITKEELRGKSIYKLNDDDMRRIVAGRVERVKKLLRDAERVIKDQPLVGRKAMDGEIILICNLYNIYPNNIENVKLEPYRVIERIMPKNELVSRIIGSMLFPICLLSSPYGKRWLRD